MHLLELPQFRSEKKKTIDDAINFFSAKENIDNSRLDYSGIIDFINYSNQAQRRRFITILKKRLKGSFNHNLFHKAVMYDLIDFETNEKQYLASIPKRKNEKSFREALAGLSDPFHYRLNEFIAIAYKLNLDLKLEKYRQLKVPEPYYEWLFDL